jgi:hypothetical protein
MEVHMATTTGNGGGGIGPWRIIGWGGAAALLLTPLVAMQFTSEVDWTLSDFVVMGAMMLAVGIPLELAARSSASVAYRLGATVALITGFLLVWVNLAVGIIGSEDNPLNLVFLGVVALTAAGAFVVRGRAHGLAATMLVAAAIQGAIALATLALGWGEHEPPGLFGVVFLIGAFAVLWLLAGALFRQAAAAEASAG